MSTLSRYISTENKDIIDNNLIYNKLEWYI